MHNQVLVIFPICVNLDDVMYYYEEIDKTQNECMVDRRCEFKLEIPEENIHETLNNIHLSFLEEYNKYLDYLKYRSEHSLKEFKERFNIDFKKNFFHSYKFTCKRLDEYHDVCNLPLDDSRLIKFIKEYSYVTGKYSDIYINGIGYGYFTNPKSLYDYYSDVNRIRFSSNTCFLMDKYGHGSNTMFLNVLDVGATVNNINELTRVWNHIIFCEKEASDSKLYSKEQFFFCESDFIVDNLEEVLLEIQDNYDGEEYIVAALDFHF